MTNGDYWNVAGVAYPAAVQHRLNERDLRCFELGEFAELLREAVRENAEALAREAGLEIEYLVCKGARKEDRIAAVLSKRGGASGAGPHLFGDGEVPLLQPNPKAFASGLAGRKSVEVFR